MSILFIINTVKCQLDDQVIDYKYINSNMRLLLRLMKNPLLFCSRIDMIRLFLYSS